MDTLLTVPPQLAAYLSCKHPAMPWKDRLAGNANDQAFITTDPVGARLGSGGGTVNVLHAAWLAATKTAPLPLDAWLSSGQRLILHSGGESRRLPAYAAVGKAFMPMPRLRPHDAHSVDQILADVQLPSYRQTLREAGPKAAALVCSGDVWLDFDAMCMPTVTADICGIGMRVSPEVAQHFGVFFVKRSLGKRGAAEQPVGFFLQKPSPAEILAHTATHDFYVDTGLWLLSAAALRCLFGRCGWSEAAKTFATPNGQPGYLDLYTEVGSALGQAAKVPEALLANGFSQLSHSVVPLTDARFLHLGSSRQLLDSMDALRGHADGQPRAYFAGCPDSGTTLTSRLPAWIEGTTARNLRLAGENLVTGLPDGTSIRDLVAGACVDAVPVGRTTWALRVYHIDDSLRGPADGEGRICGQNARRWLADRGFPIERADVFDVPIYPLVAPKGLSQELVDWFTTDRPDPALSAQVRALPRLSAAQVAAQTNFKRYYEQRNAARRAALTELFAAAAQGRTSAIFDQDAASIATFCRAHAPDLAKTILAQRRQIEAATPSPLHRSRFLMLCAELTPGKAGEALASAAFTALQSGLTSSERMTKCQPILSLKEDQIVWARSPVRLDFAGGWTDTPPFCLEQGGAVVNAAVLLNGQPPIQVFVRRLTEPVLRLRSIDLGASETVTTFKQLAGFRDPRSGFSLPKAALALAGFHPDFHAGRTPSTLAKHLENLGGGLEISLLSAVPKGSGLGTSSVIGAALLGALNRACSLGWDEVDLYDRVMGVEQLLTTGGGWQDQAGALFRGIKLVQTQPGSSQQPTVRYLPDHLLTSATANRDYLLYYTGATRLAKGILKEIVRDMFLGRAATRQTLDFIRTNATHAHQALQEGNAAAFQRCIERSWALNRALDAGTTTPEIERIIALCGPDLVACKLLGAGGGGYIFLCARDADAGRRIRERLEAQPPNPRARFVDFAIANHGLQVTVS